MGDQNLTFLDRAVVLKGGKKGGSTGRSGGRIAVEGAPNPAAKMLKLGGVALVFGLVLFGGMRFLLLSNAPRTYDDAAADAPAAAWPDRGRTGAAGDRFADDAAGPRTGQDGGVSRPMRCTTKRCRRSARGDCWKRRGCSPPW